jgi:hypothetical protein
MSRDHVAFDKISDLYDMDIPTEEEKEFIFEHFDSCSDCNLEYENLRNTLKLVGAIKNDNLLGDKFANRVLKNIKFDRRKNAFIKSFPAVAASFLIIVSSGLIGTGIFTSSDLDDSSQISELVNDSENVIDIISKYKGKILKVSEFFVEGEVSIKHYNKLRRALGFRKVRHAIVALEDAPSNFSEVSVFSTDTSNYFIPENKKVVRFKVFK